MRSAAYLEIYGRPITGVGKRRNGPSRTERKRILSEQRGKCAYCDMSFGSDVTYRGKDVALRLNWDHFVPYAYSGRNPRDNWVAACHVCNGIKGAHVFGSVEEARSFVAEIRASRVHPARLGSPGMPAA